MTTTTIQREYIPFLHELGVPLFLMGGFHTTKCRIINHFLDKRLSFLKMKMRKDDTEE